MDGFDEPAGFAIERSAVARCEYVRIADYRLNVIPVRLPSLRERRADIPMLVRYHRNQVNQTYGRDVNLAHDGFDLLTQYAWPGNVRQLRNVLERIALLATQNIVGADEVRQILAQETSDLQGGGMVSGPERPAEDRLIGVDPGVRHYRRAEPGDMTRLEAALAACGGNKSRAAQELGLTLRQFNYRLGKLRSL